MFVETALRSDAQKRVRSIGQADLLIGIPTYKNAKTVARVAQTASEGMIQAYPNLRHVLVIADGMSTDDTVQVANETSVAPGVEKMVTLYQGLMGKGTAVRAIFEIAHALKVRACVLLDADLRSLTPEWIPALANPILDGRYDYVTPLYTRHWNEVTINDSIAYPMTRMLYGLDVRQPLGGEVSLSREIIEYFLDRDVWETDVARFGLHIWMTTLAINEGWQIAQAPLTTKTHDFRDPTVGFEPKFLQVVGTLFRMLSIYRRRWPMVQTVQAAPIWGEWYPTPPESVSSMRQALREAVRKGARRFRSAWSAVMPEENYNAVVQILGQDEPRYSADLWARTVYDFSVVYNKGEGDPDKVAMGLLPLYYLHKLSWIAATEGKSHSAIEEMVQITADAFMRNKPYLLERWANYLPWEGDESLL
ncbi:MAG: hypothetical protein A2Z04_01975 [Chloroflexi bacterium RBG_16_57_9]|nr:MAG: hypothetical protein A2Z04_01975 [Chloroflexi bacterium RBG_16_57_9]